MRIELSNNYVINADKYSYWITHKYIDKKGKEKETRVSGYLNTLDSVINDFLYKKIKGSEVNTLKELLEQVNDLISEVRSWKVNLRENG